MDDLTLFHHLSEGTVDVSELPAALKAIGALVPVARAPFLGWLGPLLEHADPQIRAGAVACLGGCSGQQAARALLRALGDDDDGVREAALEGLRMLTEKQPARWVHAVFHPRAEVRRRTLEIPAALGAAAYTFYLLADPACRDLVKERFVPGETGSQERWAPPQGAQPAVLAFLREGLITRAQALKLLASGWDGFTAWLENNQRRGDEQVALWLQAAVCAPTMPGALADGGDDELDALLALFWEPAEGEDEAKIVSSFFTRLGNELLSAAEGLAQRVAAALVRQILLTGKIPARVSWLLAELHPPFLCFAWVPREVRRAAVAAYYARGEATRRQDPAVVSQLIEGDLIVHPGGGLDLWALGGLLHVVRGAPYEVLFRSVRVDLVLRSFARRCGESLPFFSLHDDSPKGSQFLLEKLRDEMPEKGAMVLALLTLAAHPDKLEFLEKIDRDDAHTTFAALLDLEAQGRSMGSRRAERVANVLVPRMGGEQGDLEALLRAWLSAPSEEPLSFGVYALVAFVRPLDADAFADMAGRLDEGLLVSLIKALPFCGTFPFGKEVALARKVQGHRSAAVRAWALKRIPGEQVQAAPPAGERHQLGDRERAELASCSEAALPGKLAALGKCRLRGLTAALAARPDPSAPCPEVCAALLGSDDPLDQVGQQLARFGSGDAAFQVKLEQLAVTTWERALSLPIQGHAWLYRWERHGFALLRLLGEKSETNPGGTLARGLEVCCAALTAPWQRARLLTAVVSVVGLLAYRDREQLAAVCSLDLAQTFAAELRGPAGESAADGLIFLLRSGMAAAHLTSVRPQVEASLPDLGDAVRARLSSWIDTTGLAAARSAPAASAAPRVDLSVEPGVVRVSGDLDALQGWCERGALSIVHEAVLRLIDLGEPGLSRLVAVLRGCGDLLRLRPILDSVELWPRGAALASARSLVSSGDLPGEIRFHLALAFTGDDPSAWRDVEDAVCAADASWFRAADWEKLAARHPDRLALAVALARSPQPHAYTSALQFLQGLPAGDPWEDAVRRGYLAFLEAGSLRLQSLRRTAATWLHRRGEPRALPVLLAAMAEGAQIPKDLLARLGERHVLAVVEAYLLLGDAVAREDTLVEQIAQAPVGSRGKALERLAADCQKDSTRQAAVRLVERHPHRSQKLRQIGETFAWGVHRGRELLGALYKVEMIGGQGLGYTRLNERRIFVSPLPILRRERNGRDIVEGLILHEFGHHLYHKGEQADKDWKASSSEGIQGLYNLVLDEHLERNVRALDEDHGDRLKRLAAYAFQHSDREIPVASLLRSLQARALPVLSSTRLRLARNPASVAVESGALMLAMERDGLAFPRFVRALRMGLGNRHRDPIVDRALALFKGGFRNRNTAAMLDIARELKNIFGWQVSLLDGIGSHESLCEGTAESIVHGDGISEQEVQEEVERVLNPEKRRQREDSGDPKVFRPWINVNPDADFGVITSVTRVDYNRAEASKYTKLVARQARHLRAFLEELGLAKVPERFRIQGRRFDPSRAQSMVIRNDPRVLIARRTVIRSDVFLSVVVDCSGSMAAGDRIERAKLFAALIAEAGRGMPGVDVRIFGFTDAVIYDAGDGRQCAAHGLRAGGGNNDAAGLWHAAQAARQSQRRSKVLVMISDGLPTECSVAALRKLVEHLTRRDKMVCAQVAVAKLSEVCFPHHVLLEGDSIDEAVRRFGALVAGLVRRSLAA